MKNLYDPAAAQEIRDRIVRLTPASQRQWGKMDVAQALAHLATTMEMAVGDSLPPRMFIGRLIGGLVKGKVLRDEAPLDRNTPTAPTMKIVDAREFAAEQKRLLDIVERFASGGPERCTRHPHTFFGHLLPNEWALLMYKHLDHHLRQFGV